MKLIFEKSEVIHGKTATFLFVESFKSEERVSQVRDELRDTSWISKLSEHLKDTYIKRMEITLSDFEKKIKTHNDDLLSYVGEKIVTICSKNAIEERLYFRKLPLGESFKSRASGNGGFDYFNENNASFYVVFGEGKFVCNHNAYNKALQQIEIFIGEGKDTIDIGDIDHFIDKRSSLNFRKGLKSYSAGFSYYSEYSKIEHIVENIKSNKCFINLISEYDLILVGVVFSDE